MLDAGFVNMKKQNFSSMIRDILSASTSSGKGQVTENEKSKTTHAFNW